VNNSLAAAHPQSPLLQQRANNELDQFHRIAGLAPPPGQRSRCYPEEPVGVAALAALTADVALV
jgi:arsenite-transporting ATPase